MKLITRMNLIGSLGLVVLAGGCATSTSDKDPTSTARGSVTHETGSTETGPGSEEPSQRGQMEGSGTSVQRETDHHGIVALIADGLSKVGLNQEQRAKIEQLGKKVTPKEQLVAEARSELQEELAEELAKGEIDETAFDDEVQELVDARTKASPVLRSALEELHEILDQQQRGELVDAITTGMQERSRRAEGWFDDFARDLRLTEDQKTKVKDVLMRAKPTLEQDRETAKKVFEAFRGEEFSMDQLVPLDEVAKRTREKAKAMISIAKSMTEILTPAQLDQLARKLEPQERERGEHQRPGHGHEGNEGEQEEQEEPSSEQPQQGGSFGQEQPMQQGEQQPQQDEPLGQVQERQFFGGVGGYGGGYGGGYRAGYVRGGVSGWGGGFGMGRSTMIGGGYAAGYPFIGGYGPGVW